MLCGILIICEFSKVLSSGGERIKYLNAEQQSCVKGYVCVVSYHYPPLSVMLLDILPAAFKDLTF